MQPLMISKASAYDVLNGFPDMIDVEEFRKALIATAKSDLALEKAKRVENLSSKESENKN